MTNMANKYRRLALAAIGIAASALLLRPQLSEALVTRGDDFAYRGNLYRSAEMYHRALWWDPDNEVAADRIAFNALLVHRHDVASNAIATTTVFLSRHGTSSTILMDRALLLQIAHRYREAERDFAVVGREMRDPRALTFAGFAAYHAGAIDRARQHWRDAMAIDPAFVLARRAMKRT